jgi:mannosyltransferase OCH1-like enzyme
MKIPRIIHQTVDNLQQVLPEYENNRQEMSKLNPLWKVKLYTSDDREDFIRSAYGNEILDAYLSIDHRYGAARADFFRYLVVLDLGGLYLDIKATATKPLDTVIYKEDTFIAAQWPTCIDGVDMSSVGRHKELSFREYQNWFVLSAPKHVVLERVVEEILRNIKSYNPFINGVGKMGVLRATGPIAYSKVVHGHIQVGGIRIATNEELGFKPTIHEIVDDKTPFLNRQSNAHYSSLRLPLISSSKFSTFIVSNFFKASYRCKRIKNRISKLIE